MKEAALRGTEATLRPLLLGAEHKERAFCWALRGKEGRRRPSQAGWEAESRRGVLGSCMGNKGGTGKSKASKHTPQQPGGSQSTPQAGLE